MNLRKKILYIQKPAGGGSLIALYEMIRVLDKSKFEPVIFCYQYNSHTAMLDKLDIKVIYYSKQQEHPVSALPARKSLKRSLRLFRKIRQFFVHDLPMAKVISRVIRENAIDLIHHNCDFPYVRQGILGNRQTKLPQVCHFRSLQPYKAYTFDWWQDRFLVKKIDCSIFISKAVKEHFKKHLDIPEKDSLVLRDIIDVQKFSRQPPDPQLMHSLGIQPNEQVVTCVGRITRWKGQDVFIRAFAEVVKKHQQTRALIVGPYEHGLGDAKFYEELKALVKTLGISEHVIFTGNRSDVPALLSISHCLVHSSVLPEPQGLVIVEALFNGTPVVVTDSGGAAELINNNEGGLKVPPSDYRAMADAISKIISGEVATVSSPAILADFDPQAQIQAIENIYSQLLQLPSAKSNEQRPTSLYNNNNQPAQAIIA